MPTSPTSGPGGSSGSGLPSQWTEGTHGDVVATVDDAAASPLLVKGIAGQTGTIFEAKAQNGDQGLFIDGDGANGLGVCFLGGHNGAAVTINQNESITITTTGALVSVGALGLTHDGMNAAPASADIGAGSFALWLDQTNGVGNTKLMVKAKSADGTVKTAAIVLT